MEPKEINYSELESKYFAQLAPDDCVVDAAAVTAVKYHYRRDYNVRIRVLITILIALLNTFFSSFINVMLFGKSFKFYGFIYFILLALFLLFTEISYRMKAAKPDKLQYFFLSKTRLFVNNRHGEMILPFSLIRKVMPIKYIGKEKKCAIINVYYGYSVLDMRKLPLYAGAADAERLYSRINQICMEENKNAN